MAFAAGQRVTAGQLNRVQPTPYSAPATGSGLAMTGTTYTDIPGCSVTLTTQAAGATYVAVGVFDASVTTTNASTLMLGHLLVDGSADTGIAIKAMDTADRDTVTMVWQGTLPSAGSHILKLQGALSAVSAGTGSFLQTDTKIQVTITEVI
jgi:hypothetical protein